MARRGSDEQLATINHRLGILDEIGHRVALIEQMNAQMAAMAARVEAATVDMEAVSALAVNVQQIVDTIAIRLEGIESRLDALTAEVRAANHVK